VIEITLRIGMWSLSVFASKTETIMSQDAETAEGSDIPGVDHRC
jgi:uncharacterized membrane protein